MSGKSCTQKTLGKPVSVSGIGLHTGSKTTITFHPAGVNEGIRFRRVDLPGQPEVRADVSNVVLEDVVRQTALGRGEVQIRTVEHVLAALTGVGIDNCLIELSSNEPPVGDGSALPFVDVLREAGLVDQEAPRQYIEIRKPICMVEPGGIELVAIPCPRLEVTFKINYDHPAVGIRAASFAVEREVFESQIAPARTFCFLRDVEKVREQGLIRGGSLENAIVIGEEGILNKDLRFEDEIVRHKVLDVIGDLALLGRPVKGHIVAVRSGHASNVKFVQRILEELRMDGQEVPQPGKNMPLPIEADDLRRILPHRYPFLLVDRVVELDHGEKRAVGIKNVTVNEPHFTGHWPDHAVMPGVLQVEAMAQVGGVLLLSFDEYAGGNALLMAIDGIKFRRKVIPGDQLRIEAVIERLRGMNAKIHTKITVDGEPVAEAQIMYRLTQRNPVPAR